jgi:uncharacterized membrane protein
MKGFAFLAVTLATMVAVIIIHLALATQTTTPVSKVHSSVDLEGVQLVEPLPPKRIGYGQFPQV